MNDCAREDFDGETNGYGRRLCLPPNVASDVFEIAHKHGHAGFDKMRENISRSFFIARLTRSLNLIELNYITQECCDERSNNLKVLVMLSGLDLGRVQC